jgi:threonine dehydratase
MDQGHEYTPLPSSGSGELVPDANDSSILHDAILAARARIAGQVENTPCLHSATLSSITGAEVYLKFENLQFTASFKERGALNCLLSLPESVRARGVIAMSAGNHAQALAYHGQRLGVPVCIVMPRTTPNAKVAQTRVFGAEIHLHGSQFDETLSYTEGLARERNLTLVHPFDDLRVIAGQGTLGVELLDQCPDMEVAIVPIGGGGLISGVATALKAASPAIEVIGVQMARYPGAYNALHGLPPAATGMGTIAEGIAVKSPGALTLPIIGERVDEILLVAESDVEQAVFTLLEIEKTLVEGAGAAGLAALQANRERFRGRRVMLILCGGNIDMMILSSVLLRGMVRSKRLVRLAVEIDDVPGALGDLTRLLGDLDSNIMEIEHRRAFGGSSVRAARLELVLQMRGEEQIDQVLAALAAGGYDASRLE